MTVIEASRNLLNYFADNDVFIIAKDLSKVVTISLDEDLDRDIVSLALQAFEEKDLVKALVKTNKKWEKETYGYVLNKPLAEYSQTIELNFPTILAIENTINNFCDELQIGKGRVNPLGLTEEDIGNLIIIIDTLTKQIQENE